VGRKKHPEAEMCGGVGRGIFADFKPCEIKAEREGEGNPLRELIWRTMTKCMVKMTDVYGSTLESGEGIPSPNRNALYS